MSAYIVSKAHICYIVSVAMSEQIIRPYGLYWDGEKHIREGDMNKAAEIANMLWEENLASIQSRYPDDTESCVEIIMPSDIKPIGRIDIAQAFKFIDCLEYQSNEHDGWPNSEALKFLDALRGGLWHALPGYEDAQWGCPADKQEIAA